MKFFTSLKSKLFAGATALALAPAAFAEDGSASSSDYSITTATEAFEGWKDTIIEYLKAATPYLIAICGAALVVLCIWIGWKILRKGASKVG